MSFLVGAGLVLVPALGGPAAHARPKPAEPARGGPQPYEGLWGSNAAACRDPDGVKRMEISGRRLFWYETRCEAEEVRAEGLAEWRMRVACEGEGERFRARPRISLPKPDRLVMENAPVTPTRRQAYVRCSRR